VPVRRRTIIVAVTTLVVLLGGAGLFSYRAGLLPAWFPGSKAVAASDPFEQSRIEDVRDAVDTVAKVDRALSSATPDGRQILLHQGHDVVAAACTEAGQVTRMPGDLATFVQHNCANGEVAPGSEFALTTGSNHDPDPGAG